MAIYHLRIKTTSRSAGKSSVERAAYRCADKFTDSRTGLTYDYTKKNDVQFSKIFMPEEKGVFENIKSSVELWNHAEVSEKRINSTVCREFEVSLPDEFTKEQNIKVASEFTNALVKRFGFAADLNIHKPRDRKLNANIESENWHAHILCTTRNHEGKKTRELDEKKSGAVIEVRQLWENICNKHLQENGFANRIDAGRSPDIEERKKIYAEEHKRLVEEQQRLSTELAEFDRAYRRTTGTNSRKDADFGKRRSRLDASRCKEISKRHSESDFRPIEFRNNESRKKERESTARSLQRNIEHSQTVGRIAREKRHETERRLINTRAENSSTRILINTSAERYSIAPIVKEKFASVREAIKKLQTETNINYMGDKQNERKSNNYTTERSEFERETDAANRKAEIIAKTKRGSFETRSSAHQSGRGKTETQNTKPTYSGSRLGM